MFEENMFDFLPISIDKHLFVPYNLVTKNKRSHAQISDFALPV